MNMSPLLKAFICAVVIGSSCHADQQASCHGSSFKHNCPYENAQHNHHNPQYNHDNHSDKQPEQFDDGSQSYGTIETKNGVLAFMENALEVSDKKRARKAILIEHLTGKNDLKYYQNEALRSILYKAQQERADTITLNDVALFLEDGTVTIMFKMSDKDKTGVEIKYNLHDAKTHSFKEGLSTLKTISQEEFSKAMSSMKHIKDESESKIRQQWKWLKEKINKYLKKGKNAFNDVVHKIK